MSDVQHIFHNSIKSAHSAIKNPPTSAAAKEKLDTTSSLFAGPVVRVVTEGVLELALVGGVVTVPVAFVGKK